MVAGMVAGEVRISHYEAASRDRDLAKLIAHWPKLPAHVKQTILTLIASVADSAD